MAFICIPVLFLPAVIGMALMFRNPGDRRTRMAAWLTLKPYLTTPLWLLILSAGASSSSVIFAVLSIAPGALLSARTYWVYQDLIVGENMTQAARILFGLDCIRWINSFFAILSLTTIDQVSPSSESFATPLAAISVFLGIALPSIFAITALIATNRVSEKVKVKRKRKNDDEDWEELAEI